MKKTMRLSLLVLLSLLLFGCSKEHVSEIEREAQVIEDEYFVTPEQAIELAQTIPTEGKWKLLGTDQEIGEARSGDASQYQPAYYLFGGEKTGFLLLSASEVAYPILGYASEGKLDPEAMPCGLAYMLEKYAAEINAARKAGLTPSEGMRALRSSTRAVAPGADIVVQPLLGDINWDQTPYYNDYAPAGTPIGCVATAVAQIMRYHEYPSRAVGQFGYDGGSYGYLHHDYNYALEWDKMPKAKLTEPNATVARFMYGVAVSVEMNFDPQGSGTTHDKVPPALRRFYKYSKDVMRITRNSAGARWTDIIKHELDLQRPVLHGGVGDGGGHSFVCDGYAENDMFHFNWGWGGVANGWFKLDALNPEDLGTGAGMGAYNRNQDIVVNFVPPARTLGDDTTPVPDDNDKVDDEDETMIEHAVAYESVYVLNPTELFVGYTKLNGKEFPSSSDGFTLFGKQSQLITATAGGKLEVEVEVTQPNASTRPVLNLFIDFNDNGTLYYQKTDAGVTKDEGEWLHSELMTSRKATLSLAIPADAKKGIHRLRLMLTDDTDRKEGKPTIYQPHASLLLIGEVEDYYVEIK